MSDSVDLYNTTKNDFDLYYNDNLINLYYDCYDSIENEYNDNDTFEEVLKNAIRTKYDEINLKNILENILIHCKLKIQNNEDIKIVFNYFDKKQWDFEDSLSNDELKIFKEIDELVFNANHKTNNY